MARIPIQERDTVNSAASPTIRDTRQGTIKPYDPAITESFAEVAQGQAKRMKQAEDDAATIRLAKHSNAVDEINNRYIATVAEAEGENVFAVSDVAKQNLNRDLQKLNQELPDNIRDRGTIYSDKSVNDFNKFNTSHTYKELSAVRDQTVQARTEILTTKLAINAMNPEEHENTFDEMDTIIDQHRRMTIGDSPNARAIGENTKAKARSTAHLKAAEQFASINSFPQLRSYAEKYKDRFLPDDKLKLEALMDKADNDETFSIARNLVDRAYELTENASEANEYIIKNSPNGKVAAIAQPMGTTKGRLIVEQRKTDEQTAMDTALKTIAQNRGQVSDSVYTALTQDNAVKARQYAVRVSQGQDVVSRPGEYLRLFNMYRSDSDAFMKENLDSYRGVLNSKEVDILQSLKRSVAGREASNADRLRGEHVLSAAQTIASIAKANNFEIDDTLNAGFTSYANDVYVRLLRENEGKKAYTQDVLNEFEKRLRSSTLQLKDRKWWQVVGENIPYLEYKAPREFESDPIVEYIKRFESAPKGPTFVPQSNQEATNVPANTADQAGPKILDKVNRMLDTAKKPRTEKNINAVLQILKSQNINIGE